MIMNMFGFLLAGEYIAFVAGCFVYRLMVDYNYLSLVTILSNLQTTLCSPKYIIIHYIR